MGFSAMTTPGGALAHNALFSLLAAVERPFCWTFFALNVLACVTAAARTTFADTLLCAAVALCVAEASTSLFHYWGDRRVFVAWPLFCHYDRAYARHHRDPDDIVASGAMGYAQWVGDVALLPLCAPVWLMLAAYDAPLSTVASVLLWVCTFIAVAADTHRLAHCAPADVPTAVAALQACGLLLSADSHERHHDLVRRTGRLAYFSVLTGWSNRIQDLSGVGVQSSSLTPSASK
ncbi:B of TMEM189, localization domain containing protein [Pandoravirus neocaledonia]|uniref:B of TMEM189, localization domain containing protein n=1 Tax=Pandoravirus neocaledonia TaxID=2107708 RepID=A0A2U7UC41_9VIRU|nr:B of TMEM189, localization domain containing protein [Pandoravirus neocaledonia]AVK76003.1 B of TMEM189, localization domain containing protein [Pandoravirus neocaledonia]